MWRMPDSMIASGAARQALLPLPRPRLGHTPFRLTARRVAGSALWVFGHSTDQFFDLDIRQHSLALALDIACNSLAGVAAAVAQSLTLGPR